MIAWVEPIDIITFTLAATPVTAELLLQTLVDLDPPPYTIRDRFHIFVLAFVLAESRGRVLEEAQAGVCISACS